MAHNVGRGLKGNPKGLLGRVQGLEGLRGLPRFPRLVSSPRGPVAQKMARRASAGRTSAPTQHLVLGPS